MDGLDAQNAILPRDESAIPSGKILLSGASGMLGSAIARALKSEGKSILRLIRKVAAEPDTLRWSPEASEIDRPERLEAISTAIHLSGANVAGQRWTSAFKREMWESRVRSTRLLAETLARLKQPPQVLISASAVGIYGNRGAEPLKESSHPGRGFFPELCVAWEAATQPAVEAGIRVVHIRTGIVLGREGGALQKMVPIFRLGLGGKLGDGSQWMSWIAEADHVSAVLFLIAADISGPVNLVAPNPVTNADFTCELAHALRRPAFLPAPAFGLRLAFGQMADDALLASTRVLPEKLQQTRFNFRFPTLQQALAEVL